MPNSDNLQIPLFSGVELPRIQNRTIGIGDNIDVVTFSCRHCGNEIETDDGVDLDGEEHCRDCVCTCEVCDRIILLDNAITANVSGYRCHGRTRIVCESCQWECTDCSEHFLEDADSGVNAHEDRVCARCAENYSYCEDCNGTFSSDDMRLHRPTEEYVCRDCHRQRMDSGSGGLHSYSHKPTPILNAVEGEVDKMFMGWELEVDHKQSRNVGEDIEGSSLHEHDIFYCKEDGSLANGFEIVSHPCTFNYWRTTPLPFLFELKKMGYRSFDTDTCGFHVHVSKSALTELDQMKLLQFFKNNNRFVQALSRRKEENLARWARVEDGTASVIKRKVKRGPTERYEAINLCNEHTVEFRIFRGTLDERSLRRNLAFVYSLCRFVKCHWLREMSRIEYVKWMSTEGIAIVGEPEATDLIKWVSKL